MKQKLPPAEALTELSPSATGVVRLGSSIKRTRTPAAKQRAEVMSRKKTSTRKKAG